MAPKCTLVYFNGKGRGEIARLVFTAAGQEFTDKRVEFSEWPALKPKTPWGFLPVLEFGGIEISQHLTIARYLAREFGLGGKDSVEQGLADSVADTAVELYQAGYPIMFEKDETKKAALKKTYLETTTPGLLTNLEKFLRRNGGGDGYFVGKGLTWADLIVLHGLEVASELGVKLADYPKISANRKRVEALPKIAAYLKARPNTPF